MNFLRTLAPFVSRGAMMPTIGSFTIIGGRHLLQPIPVTQSVAFAAPAGITDFRIAFGGFPIGVALFLFVCVLYRGWRLPGLVFTALLITVVVLARAYGMVMDSTVSANLQLLVIEFILIGITLAGVAAELYQRAENRRPA